MTLVAILALTLSNAQENYSQMTQKALETMWKAKDDADYRTALALYETAFTSYPDSIDGLGLYKASVIAAELREYDKAFQYLRPLAGRKASSGDYPGWVYIVGESADSEYKNLLQDTRWQVLKQVALADQRQFYVELDQTRQEFFKTKNDAVDAKQNPKKIYAQIKTQNSYLPKNQRDYSISFRINDMTQTSYFIHLPRNYDPAKPYALLFFLHGAVRNNALVDYQSASGNLDGWNRYYTKYADLDDVILVFPRGNRKYNWMTPDDGFFMVPKMLVEIKSALHIDDDRVFISGHSNGATGSFSYLMKQPTPFAGFYGFNTYPKVFTGGTFVENIKNRSFVNFSTDRDYYYPPKANDDLSKLMHDINADYKDHRYNGFPHWFPQFDESEAAFQIVFKDISGRKRNAFPREISWEFDDERYGNADWLASAKLDTLQPRANWQSERNFEITKWLEYDKNDSLKTKEVSRKAFDCKRKSGRIKATYDNNVFRIETSCVKLFSVKISPEMVDLSKKVKVYVNGKLHFDEKVKYDRAFLLQNFGKTKDRKQLWVASISVKT